MFPIPPDPSSISSYRTYIPPAAGQGEVTVPSGDHIFAEKRSLGLPGVRFKWDSNKNLDMLHVSLLFPLAQHIFPVGHIEEAGEAIKAKLV